MRGRRGWYEAVVWLDRRLLGATADAAPEEARRARVVAWFCFLVAGPCLVWAPIGHFEYGLSALSAACGIAGIAFVSYIALLRRGIPVRTVSVAVVATAMAVLVAAATLSFGVSAIFTPWLVVVVMVAAYLLDHRWGVVAAAAMSVIIVVLFALEVRGVLVPALRTFDRAEQLIGPTLLSLWVSTALIVAYRLTLDGEMRQKLRIEQELQQAQRLEAMGRLVSGLAHEVNNPLTFVLGNVELVRQRLGDRGTPTDLEDIAFLDDALQGVERIRRLVADLQLFSRDTEEPAAWVSVDEVVRFAVKLTHHVVRHAARVTVEVDPRLEVRVPPGRLGQVLVNLLTNAAQAMPAGEAATHRILVRATAVGDGCRLEVEDTGAGMDERTLARVFDPFFTTRPVGSGTGLGLPISLSLVRAMGGDLSVTSRPGGGTTVRVWVTEARRSAADPAPTPEAAPVRLPVGTRVLVVDDEPEVGTAIARALPDLDVVTETRAVEALARCARERFSIVLCDLSMPEMDGEAFLDALRDRAPEAARRVVFVTGGAVTPEKAAFLSRHPVLTKPIGARELRTAVAAHLGALREVPASVGAAAHRG